MRAVVRRSTAVPVALVLLAAAGAAPAVAGPMSTASGPASVAPGPTRAPAIADPAGASIVVTTLADVTADDGACSLREAIIDADTDGSIFPTPGECAAGSAAGEDVITFSVAGTILLAENLPDVGDATTIDGGGTVAIDGRPSAHALTVQANSTVTLRRLDLAGAADSGGGVNNRGTLTMEDCFVHDSTARYGGGLYTAGPAMLIDTVFTGNHAGTGGAIYEAVGGVTLVRSSVSENVAVWGGGIESGTELMLDRSLVSGNVATTEDPLLEGVNGGGIVVFHLATIVQSSIIDNRADDNGGGVMAWGNVEVLRSTLAGNSAARGGGIATMSDLLIANSTFTGNTASIRGGALDQQVDNYALSVHNATIVRNAAPAAPGIHGAVIRLQNSLVLGNTPESEPQVDAVPTMDSVGSLTAPPAGLTVDDIVDPTGLADHGGATPTVLLAPGPNPAADAGDAEACAAPPVDGMDQRGLARTGPCDVGAVERDTVAPRVTLRPTVTIRRGATLAGTAAPVFLRWAATDVGSGVDHVILERSRNGGPWAVLGSLTGSPEPMVLSTSGTTRYRVIAIDRDGNPSSPSAGPVLTARLVQQSSSSIRYAGRWTRATTAAASGGSRVAATKAGASATFTFTGRSVAFVTMRAPTRGKVAVYQGTRRLATLDLRGGTTERYVAWTGVWSTSATRTIRLVVLGTAGRPRVDLDAFVVLK